MSRSRRKTPIVGIATAKSEAFDKQTWHRAYRRAEKVRAEHDPDGEPCNFRGFTDAWSRQKDGKQYLSKACPVRDKLMRK